MPRRIKITLAYDGTEFHGWQVQPDQVTIQGTLEAIISDMEGKPVHVAGSGRTDAGVHARAQIAAFTLENPIPPENLQRAVNRLLPPAIRILEVAEVHPSFHPRFDSIAKTYQYKMMRSPICPPFEWRYVHHYPYPLNEPAMIEAAGVFTGEHDFRPMAASDDRYAEQSTVRTIFSSTLERSGDHLIYTVRGSGFLKHMVRNIVGSLIEVGRGNRPPSDALQNAGATAPAKGLTLICVEYPHVSLEASDFPI